MATCWHRYDKNFVLQKNTQSSSTNAPSPPYHLNQNNVNGKFSRGFQEYKFPENHMTFLITNLAQHVSVSLLNPLHTQYTHP